MHLVIRADASTEIGTGHVVRCLALAEAWLAKGGEVYLASAALPEPLRANLETAGVNCHDIAAEPGGSDDAVRTRALADSVDATWLVQDGYSFDAGFQAALKAGGRRLLVIDDYGRSRDYCCDLILNQNLHADAGLYPVRQSGTRLLLGARYVLLRRQFAKWQGWERETLPQARRVLVSLGGGDATGLAPRMIDALAQLGSGAMEAVVTTGSANPRVPDAVAAAARAPFPVRVERSVSDMAALMAWAEVSISAGGTTCWELAFMGVPNCIVSVNEDQRLVARSLQERGAALHLEDGEEALGTVAARIAALASDPVRRATMSRQARKTIDGRGAERVVSILHAATVRLRPATWEDREFLWTLRNEEGVRAASFNTSLISWADHVRWFESAMSDADCVIWIATDSMGAPTGQGRFHIQGAEAQISMSVTPACRGRGYGSVLIRALSDQAVTSHPEIRQITALIKQDNARSRRAFEQADYVLDRMVSIGEEAACRYVRARED